jgi:NAD(P)H-nitrite reductase large subunit
MCVKIVTENSTPETPLTTSPIPQTDDSPSVIVHLDPRIKRYVIVGNGIAGTSAAEHLRRGDANAEISLLTNEPYSLYNRIALPPFLKGKVTEQKVMIKGKAWHDEMRIGLHTSTQVHRVDSANRLVITADGTELPYDALLIATGGRPNPLPAPGAGVEGVYNFQTLDDAKAINDRINSARRAVVVGGSYISYELAEAFRSRGLDVTWLMRAPWFLRRTLEAEGGKLVDDIAASHGVEVVHGEEIAEVHSRDGQVTGVTTTGGRFVEANIIGAGVGISRNLSLLEETDVETRQGVVTDIYLRTNVPNIFAAGDVAEFYDPTLDCHYTMGTWDNATNHGKTAAVNMVGGQKAYREVPTYSTTLFHSRIAAVGATPDVRSDIEGEAAIDHESQTYRRLFFVDNLLVGAVLIGERRGRQRLIDLIQSRTPIPQSERTRLLDMSVPL